MRLLAVWGVLYYLRFWAKVALAIHKPIVIGVAGSLGKSSVTMAIYSMLRDYFPTKYTEGNSETGIPLSILGIRPNDFSWMDWLRMIVSAPFGLGHLAGTKYLVAEMGTDGPKPPKNMEYLLSIVKPNYSIWLNADPAHTQQFSDGLTDLEKELPEKDRVEAIQRVIAVEDGKIITQSGCKVAIVNSDDKFISDVVRGFDAKGKGVKILKFGNRKEADLRIVDWEINLERTYYEFSFADDKKIKVRLDGLVLPQEYGQTIGSVLVLGRELGLTTDQITSSIEKNIRLPKGRATIMNGLKQIVIFDSSYNASKVSTVVFLDLLGKLKAQTRRPVGVLMGDMRELGEVSEVEHQAVAEKIIEVADYLYCVGPLTKKYVIPVAERSGKIKGIHWFNDSVEAGKFIKTDLPEKSLILVKGSQNGIFLEEAIKLVLKKTDDQKLLCRQEESWMKRKQLFFASNVSA